MRTQRPLTFGALLASAVVSWTCTQETPLRADAPDVVSAGGETRGDLRTRADADAVAEALAPSREERDLEVYVDEGVPGLRIPIHDPGGRALDGLHEGLRRAAAGEGQARIVVYGASHVASDTFTGHMREQLQTRFGDAGHGFILPVQPWRGYRHRHVEVESDWRRWDARRIRVRNLEVDQVGLAGVAVETDRAGAWGAVTTASQGPIGQRAGLYDLYYLKQPGGGDFDVFIDGERAERIRTAADDPAPGYATFEVEDGPHRFEIRARGNGPVRIFGVAVERRNPGVVVDTLGINGARARLQLLWDDALYREHLARRNPDLVVLAYGTNEAGDDDEPIERYEQRLREVVGRVRETVPRASCLLIGPSDRPLHDRRARTVADRPRTGQLVEVQRRVSEELGCGFFDLVTFMGGPLSMQQWVEAGYARDDYVHLTADGYQRLGVALLEAMMRDFRDPADPGEADAEDAVASVP